MMNFTRSVKWVTENDEKVCALCGKLSGKIFPENLHPKLPIHKNCRCKLESVNIESHYHKGQIIVGSGDSIAKRISLDFLKGVQFKYTPEDESTPTTVIAFDDARVKEAKSRVRIRTLASLKKSYNRYKMLEDSPTFGFSSRRLIGSDKAKGRKIDRPDTEETGTEATVDIRRSGIILEYESMFNSLSIMGDVIEGGVL